MTFDTRHWASATERWQLTGRADPFTDHLVAAAIGSGWELECLTPRTSYRVAGEAAKIRELAALFAALDDGVIVLRPEPAPGISACTSRPPARASGRRVFVHGECEDAFRQVARAVDADLQVTAAGRYRWCVTGSTAALLAWASEHVYRVPVDEVMPLWALTPEAAAVEDAR